MYKPSVPFNVPMMLLIPTSYTASYGVESKSYPNADMGILFFGSFRTFGGTERDIDGAFSVENTGVINTWYRPDIQSNCRIAIPQTESVYEIIGEPENIQMQNQYLQFKVREIKGGA